MAIIPGTKSNQPQEQQQDTFTAVEPVQSSRPNTLEPKVEEVEQVAARDQVHVDESQDFEQQRQQTSLALAMDRQFSKPADQAARQLKAEMDSGLPADYVAQNLDEVEKLTHNQAFSLDDFQARSPKFAQWVAENENHYPLVRNDLAKFQAIEEQTAVGMGYDQAKLQREKSDIIGRKRDGSYSEQDKVREAEINKELELQALRSEGEGFGGMLARTGGYTARQFVDSSKAAAVGAGVGALVAPFTAGLSIPAGAKIGATTALALDSYAMESNFAWEELSNIRDANGKGLDRDTIDWVARGIGVINAGIETAGDITFARMIPGADKLLGSLTKSTRKNLTEAAVKLLAKDTAGAALKEAAIKMFKGSAAEGATEFIQSLVGATGKRVAQSADELQVNSSWAEDLSGGVQEGADAFWGSMVTLGAVHATTDFGKRMKAIRNGEENVRMMNALAEGVKSEAFQKLPAKGQEAVGRMLQGTGKETVHMQVEPWVQYWQSKGADPRDMAARVALDGGKSFDQAFESGGFIEIPTERFGRALGPTEHFNELMLDATFDPTKETPREAMENQRLLEEEAKATETADKAQSSAVEQKVYEQLKAAKDPGDARKKAKVFARINEQMAAEAGETPEAFFDKYGLQIRRVLPQRLQEKNINELDPLLDRLRAGDVPTEAQARGQSLMEFLRDKGGIKPIGQGTDVASLEPDRERAAFVKNLIQPNGMEVDRAIEAALEHGYLQSGDTQEFLNAIQDEIGGNPRYALGTENSPVMDEIQTFAELQGHLKTLGADLATMDNAQIKKLIEDNKPIASDQREDIFLQFGGRKAKTAPAQTLAKAAQLLKDGTDMEAIRKETGWFQGPDKRWRFEISDEQAKFKDLNLNKKKKYLLGDVLDHPQLFAAYPELANDIKVEFVAFRGRKGGHWDRTTNTIQVAVEKVADPNSRIVKELNEIKNSQEYRNYVADLLDATDEQAQARTDEFLKTEIGQRYKQAVRAERMVKPDTIYPKAIPAESLNTILHEVQHALQTKEGFAPGANRRADGAAGYTNSLGEVEARDVEKRRTMTEEERAGKTPSTQTWKNPVIKWDKVTEELPIEELGPELGPVILGEQMSLFQAGSADPRGRIRFGLSRQMNIDLYKGADFSTFLHEQAHYWLEVMGDIAESGAGSERIKSMYADTLKHLGVSSRAEIQVEHHEKFAESFEKYLMEGKAPTPALQEIFNTFKAWLTWVYHSLTGLDVELSPEIRSVFDRMLASDEEIARAQQEQNMQPLILDPIAAGMTPEQVDKYTALVNEARSEATHELTVKMMAQIQKERTKIWKDERAEVKARIAAEVEAQPDQVLLKMLRAGKMEGRADIRVKLDRKAMVKAYGKEFVARLPHGIFGKDGLNHNDLASLLGFESGWDMVQMIANTQDKAKLIEQLTDDEMTARHGDEDLFKNGKLYDAALEAVHNDKRAELMRMEFEWLMQNRTKDAKGLVKALARRAPPISAIRAKAEQTVAQISVSQIKPHTYLRAERKYGNEAVQKMLAGDFDGALDAKRKEILNHELYRVSTKAKEQIDRISSRFAKFFQEDERIAKRRDLNLVKAGRAILAGFGFGTDERSPEEHLKQLKDYDPEGYAAVADRVQAALENADYYENLSFEKFVALGDLVGGLWDQARSDMQVEVDGKKVAFQEVVDTLVAGASKLPQFKPDKGGYSRLTTEDELALNGFQTIKARSTRMQSKVSAMDAFADGAISKYLYNSVRNATERYRAKHGEIMARLAGLVEGHKGNFGGAEIVSDELRHVFKNKAELLGALLHTGNESNLRRLLLGNGWAELREDRTLDRRTWDQFIERCWDQGILTKADYDFVQGIWDTLESFKKDTQAAHKEMYGFHFAEITANEIETPWGKYKGGYVPATADRTRSKDPQIRNEKAMIEDNFFSELPQKNDGFTKERAANYATPLVMDIGLVLPHVDNALRFTYITPRVREVLKLVHNREVRNALDDHDPAFVSHVVIPFLQRASTQKTTNASGNKFADEFFSFAKTNSAIQLMFLNIPNTLQQAANYIPAALRASPKYLVNAVVSGTFKNKEVTQAIAAKSVFMKNQYEGLAAESRSKIENLIKDRNTIERGSEWLARNAYIAQTAFQNIMNTHVWLASYDQAISDGLPEAEAVQYADNAIRETQGSFAAEDTAAVETNTPLMKTLMMFFGFFNNMANLYTSEWAKAGALKSGAKELERAKIVANYFLFAFAGKIIIDAARGKIGKDDEEKDSFEFWLKYVFGSAFELAAPAAGPVGQAAYTGYKNLIGESSYSDRISVSPLISSAEQLAKGIGNIRRDEPNKKTAVKDAMTLIADSPLLGFAPKLTPLKALGGYSAAIGALRRPVGYAVGVSQDKDSAETAGNVAQGIVTGSSKR